jgi:hypothetical protein
MIRMLVVSVLVLWGATDLRAQEDRSCRSRTQEVGAKALAVFEEEHDLTIVAGDYKPVAGEVAAGICAQMTDKASDARIETEATKRYLTDLLAFGQATSVRSIVADVVNGTKGLGEFRWFEDQLHRIVLRESRRNRWRARRRVREADTSREWIPTDLDSQPWLA